jgi:hypothetical protein
METTMLKQEVRKVMVVSPPADERPLFAPEFVRVMTDSAYETLRAYLEKAKARPEAISLLDDLVLLLSWRSMQERGKVTWIENQGATESLGSLSYDIFALGGGSLLKQ